MELELSWEKYNCKYKPEERSLVSGDKTNSLREGDPTEIPLVL
jgi:hypothetical protein